MRKVHVVRVQMSITLKIDCFEIVWTMDRIKSVNWYFGDNYIGKEKQRCPGQRDGKETTSVERNKGSPVAGSCVIAIAVIKAPFTFAVTVVPKVQTSLDR